MLLKDKLIIVAKIVGIAAGAWFIFYWFPMVGFGKYAEWKMSRYGIINQNLKLGCIDIKNDKNLPTEFIFSENACAFRKQIIPKGVEMKRGVAHDVYEAKVWLHTDKPIELANWYRMELEKNGWTWTGPKWVGTPPSVDVAAASAHYVNGSGASLSVLAETTPGLESVELALIK